VVRRSKVQVKWDGGRVSAFVYSKSGTPLLLAHGAGTNQDHPRMMALAEELARRDLQVMTFNYPYTEAGRRSPDRPAVLLECHRAARDRLAEAAGSAVILGGRSMGGRMGTYLAAAPEPCRAVVLYAYPLHPPGQPDKLRVEHLRDIKVPMLFFQGTRDALARMDLFDKHIRPLANTEVEILEGASHSLDRNQATTKLLAERTASWVQGW
jgi:predicted alpha/beta-hydrolase family hydrolase